MTYNFALDFDCNKFDIAVERAKRLKKKVNFSTKSKKRSLSINAYLHVLIQYFAVEYGDTTKHVKEEIYKKQVNSEIYFVWFENKKQGYSRDSYRSSADLTDKEMALSIERFKTYAAKEAGILLPSADQKKFLEHCLEEIEKNQYYI